MNIDKLLHIQSNTLTATKGKVLLSEPLMADFYFGRSVVLLVEHEENEGSFGLIMNKKVDKSLNEIVQDFPRFEAPVFLGGPVQTNQLFYLHTLGDLIPNSLQVMNGLYWGGDMEVLQSMIETGVVNNSQVRFFLGYAGWETKQLTDELKRNSWLVSDASVSALFRTKSQLMWRHFVRRMGTNYEKWLKLPEDYSLN